MQVYNEINSRNRNLSVALGFFDGIHLGHIAVLSSAVDCAKREGLNSALITFENHPECFFKKCEPEYILSKRDKLELFEKLGFDYLYSLRFDKTLSSQTAYDYLKMLCDNLSLKFIFTGFNHSFGANREGTPQLLEDNQARFNYKYFKIDPVRVDGEVVSSTVIRKNLKQGNIEKVNKMLGRRYSIAGIVVEGEKIGRTIGFKTANLFYPKHLVNIGRGVYSVEVQHNGRMFMGIANFGMRPSLGNTDIPILEVHILDFDEDIYGDELRVWFIKKIREEKKFGSLSELRMQIIKDIREV